MQLGFACLPSRLAIGFEPLRGGDSGGELRRLEGGDDCPVAVEVFEGNLGDPSLHPARGRREDYPG